jgi:hypothetical protein
MMQMEQKQANAPNEHLTPDEQNRRLQALVGELVKANQELRFKVASLERQAESMERSVKAATAWAGPMF